MKLLEPECFAVMADDELRRRSSSGGAFSVLARSILARGGAVCGAAFGEKMEVRHVIARTESELGPLRGSKYARSTVSPALLDEIERILDGGSVVAFVGTPCQVDAVKRRFGRYGDLFLGVDLVCGGAPEQKYFTSYLNENWGVENVKEFEFRSKARGWRSHHYLLRILLKDGREVWRERSDDEFMPAMAMGFTKPDACFSCRYCSMNRPGDITIGDFWGVPPEMDDGNGTSLVIANTDAGRQWFARVRADFRKVRQYPPEFVRSRQRTLRFPASPHPALGTFRKMVSEGKTIREALDVCMHDLDRNVGILNFHWETVNFGAVLTAYALNSAIRSLGYNAVNVNFKPDLPRVLRKPANPLFDEFRSKYIPQTYPVLSGQSLRGINSIFGTFVVGSDQVWNKNIGGWYRDVYFLSFASPEKRLVSAAASFGCDPRKTYGTGLLRKLLRPFDAVSVRESSSLPAVARTGVPAVLACDPVFMLKRDEWLRLADKSSAQRGGVVWYCVNQSEKGKIERFLEVCSRSSDANPRRLDMRIGIEDWLASIASASLVVTDSFHGMCFALIFNRPFVVFASSGPKTERMRGILESMGVERRLFVDPDNAPSVEELLKPIDFESVNAAIGKMRQEALAWLQESLSRPVKADAPRIGAMKSRNLALVSRELWRILLVVGFTWFVMLKAAAKLMLGRSISAQAAEIAKRDAEIAGRKAAVMRLMSQWKALRSARPAADNS